MKRKKKRVFSEFISIKYSGTKFSKNDTMYLPKHVFAPKIIIATGENEKNLGDFSQCSGTFSKGKLQKNNDVTTSTFSSYINFHVQTAMAVKSKNEIIRDRTRTQQQQHIKLVNEFVIVGFPKSL